MPDHEENSAAPNPMPSDRASSAYSPADTLPSGPAAITPTKRDRAFRRALIEKLPRINNSRWETADTMNLLDEITAIVELDSDTFLEPLERLAGGSR